MEINELLNKVKKYNRRANLALIKKAYGFALDAHGGQIRASGDPYISHPLAVADILADLKLDTETIVAAILHDIVEDTIFSLEKIREEFGEEIANLVDGVTKLSTLNVSNESGNLTGTKTREDRQAENLRKIFLAMAKDIRVILIKLGDRLHNLRTLSSLPVHKRRKIAQETLEIYAPISSRLGLWRLKWELEDLSFSYIEPEKYEELVTKIAKKRAEREAVINDVIETLKKKLRELRIKACTIDGRPKHLYSIYHKMKKKSRDFSEIYDLFAVRIIVNSIEDCYAVLGAAHNLWIPFKDRIKDYIAVPKANNYKSLHTTVYGPGGDLLEVQIRTMEMHLVNEYGIAAHWAYKENKKGPANMTQDVFPWVKYLLDWKDESRDAKEYVENLKLELLGHQVFIFSPKGDVIDLPAGSTPIDFAYRIHTEIGHRCVGAKVNTKIVPLDYKLQNADIVDIITSKNNSPSFDWLKICKSSHAKNKIRQWFKKEDRDKNVQRGRDLLEKELRRLRLNFSELEIDKTDFLETIMKKLKFTSIDDMYASMGYGETSIPNVVTRMNEELSKLIPVTDEESIEKIVTKPQKIKRKKGNPILVKGLDNILIKFSKCCHPLPGDEIKGYVTLGQGVSVHRHDCYNLMMLTNLPERLVEVGWNPDYKDGTYSVELEIESWDRAGLLGDILNVVNDYRIQVHACKAWAQNERAVVRLSLDVKNCEQLEEMKRKILTIKDVIRAVRVVSIPVKGGF